MNVLRSLLFLLVLGVVPLYAAEKADSPAELKKQIEAVHRETADLEAQNADLRKKISELEQKTRELSPRALGTEQKPASPAAPAKPARKKVVLPPPEPEPSFLDSLLAADPMMLGAGAGAILLLGALVIVMRRRRA